MCLLQGHAAAKPALERALTQAQEALHPMHAIIVDCLMPLVNCSRATQDLPAAIRYLQQLLAALDVIIGCHSVEVHILPDHIYTSQTVFLCLTQAAFFATVCLTVPGFDTDAYCRPLAMHHFAIVAHVTHRCIL